MGIPPVGTIVLVEFPYANLRQTKKRPAVIAAHSSMNTVIICQVTSKQVPNTPAVKITNHDFVSGSLPITSFVRPDKLHTIDSVLASHKLGLLSPQKLTEIKSEIAKLFI